MPEPRTWSVTYPPEPGPEVTKVRDGDGDLWRRIDGGWTTRPPGSFGGAVPWDGIFEFGDTVTDATHEETTDA